MQEWDQKQKKHAHLSETVLAAAWVTNRERVNSVKPLERADVEWLRPTYSTKKRLVHNRQRKLNIREEQKGRERERFALLPLMEQVEMCREWQDKDALLCEFSVRGKHFAKMYYVDQ